MRRKPKSYFLFRFLKGAGERFPYTCVRMYLFLHYFKLRLPKRKRDRERETTEQSGAGADIKGLCLSSWRERQRGRIKQKMEVT